MVKNEREFRKKIQKAARKKVREFNKNLKKDTLWKGRFEVRQMWDRFDIFEDKSGGVLKLGYRIVDKKYPEDYMDFVCEIWDYHPESYSVKAFCWDMCKYINNIIIEDFDVWRKDDVRNLKEDYTNIESNFYLDKKFAEDFVHFRGRA